MNFNKVYINFLTIIVTSIIFIIIILSPLKNPLLAINKKQNDIIKIEIKKLFSNIEQEKDKNIKENIIIEEQQKENIIGIEENEMESNYNTKDKPKIWKIFIPSLNMQSNIKDGTNIEIITKVVGHYKTTNITEGKIALYALNSGNSSIKKYFSNLKELKVGEKIYYTIDEETIKYEVYANKIISNDFEMINQINYDCLILITNVIDMPSAKRCVIAKK